MASGGDAEGDRLSGIQSLQGSAFADRLTGGDDASFLRGGDGADTLSGGWGADQLWGEGGDDVLIGGGDADVFEFFDVVGAGRDTVADFDVEGGDVLRFRGLDGRAGLEIAQAGDDVQITGAHVRVVVQNATLAELDGAALAFL